MSFATGINSNIMERKKNISDAEIVSYYLGITKIPTRICSPLRKDTKPSFGLYSRDGEHIYYTDFATGDKGSVIDLLMQLWGLSYDKVWERIVNELTPLNNVTINKSITKAKLESLDKNKADIRVVIREWNSDDMQYWNSYGITKDWLEYANIHPISYIIFQKENKQPVVLKADKLAYTYVEFKENNTTYKIYQPLNKKGCKWFSTHDRSVISLWTKVPENGNKLVICSSMKDALCLWVNTGIPAIAIQGEGYSMSDTAISELKRRYKKIYILLDNDRVGLRDAEKLAKETGFINVILPFFTDGKDISDLYKAVGKKEFLKTILPLFN